MKLNKKAKAKKASRKGRKEKADATLLPWCGSLFGQSVKVFQFPGLVFGFRPSVFGLRISGSAAATSATSEPILAGGG